MSTTQVNLLKFIKDMEENDLNLDVGDEVSKSPIFNGIFKEYEQVVVKSLITSFGLDGLLLVDRRGGDVDTIHTVRDESVKDYADKSNQQAYENRGDYDAHSYHNHSNYKHTNKKVSEQKKSGNLEDAYTGNKVSQNGHVDLDHTIAAYAIHNDPGRVLAGIEGEELANRDTNLNATNRSVNRSKKAKTSEEFLKKLKADQEKRQTKIRELKSKKKLTDKEKKELNKLEKLESVDAEKLKKKDAIAREAYEREVATKYYTSSKFLKSTAKTSLKKGASMGLRQCLGLILTEVWFTVREEFPRIIDKIKENFELPKFLKEMGKAIQKAFERVRSNYKQLISTFKDGMLAGILSSLTSTLTNIFFTTAKSIGRILRESWASIIEAVKILVFNPDHLPFGEVIRSVAKIMATCVSVICGNLVQQALLQMNPIKIPIIADVIPTFVGSMVTGIMTVSMLYFLDHSKMVQGVVARANQLKDQLDDQIDYYKQVNVQLTKYVAELAAIDYEVLEKELAQLKVMRQTLDRAKTVTELNQALHEILKARNIELPYQSLKAFMNDKDAVLII